MGQHLLLLVSGRELCLHSQGEPAAAAAEVRRAHLQSENLLLLRFVVLTTVGHRRRGAWGRPQRVPVQFMKYEGNMHQRNPQEPSLD